MDGVEIWKSEHGIPHWHYVTYGFTELYEKKSEDPEVSGYGFELTFRLKRGKEIKFTCANNIQHFCGYILRLLKLFS